MKWMPLAFVLIVIAGLGLRVPRLAERPMHHDEANQAYRFGILLEEGTYEYDANDHHGPTLYYLTLPIAWLTGAKTFADTDLITYRALPVVFGMLLILALPLLRSGMGCIAVLAAALFTAISPGLAYYSRFYIQEISLVFFTLVAIAAGWHSVRSGARSWAIVAGLSAGLMFATKETAVISFAALAGAAILCMVFSRHGHLPIGNILLAAACAVLVSSLLFSSFLTNLSGPLESILAFKGYFARGTGVETEHVHPWNFYLKMLVRYRFAGGPVWSEGLAFGLGLLGCVAIVRRKLPTNCDHGLASFLMYYTVLLTLAYSLIAYKTPWCILSLLHGWVLLAGIGVAAVFEGCRQTVTLRRASLVLQLAVAALLAYPVYATYRLARRTVFNYAADERNPYVYAHTSPDFNNLVRRIAEIEAVSPKGKQMYIQVIAEPESNWPLPFYLRQFPNVGYWVDAHSVPAKPKPDLIISGTEFETPEDEFLCEFYGLRADTPLAIHIDKTLWDAFLESRR
ncbi:flippase activity-associated protein Agl23 [Pontiella sp.]|uniref:flippase activity-associated protein Agl23 n=1 Tax=Pontiella sp. TaxID=2837462 RepID=UPI003566C57D